VRQPAAGVSTGQTKFYVSKPISRPFPRRPGSGGGYGGISNFAAGRGWAAIGIEGPRPRILQRSRRTALRGRIAAASPAKLTVSYDSSSPPGDFSCKNRKEEANLYRKDDRAPGSARVFSDLDAGLRLRYEIKPPRFRGPMWA